MTFSDLLLQQAINGLSLGAMYALLALGFTLVYGILELINFAHFNVFMIGSFIAMGALQSFGLSGQDVILTGLPLVGVLLAAFAATMLGSGMLGMAIERLSLRPLRNETGPAAMIATIGVSYILFNVVLLTLGADSKNFPNPLPPVRWHLGGAVVELRQLLIWAVAVVLMGGLWLFVQRSKL
ncbi:MAG: branched-chain amino acid ABC transporter permease, partial [Acetobacteraceae bacterium]|nr:branched-chain amino acid ABC transporter permease [Acetobacteraceae bacterium]